MQSEKQCCTESESWENRRVSFYQSSKQTDEQNILELLHSVRSFGFIILISSKVKVSWVLIQASGIFLCKNQDELQRLPELPSTTIRPPPDPPSEPDQSASHTLLSHPDCVQWPELYFLFRRDDTIRSTAFWCLRSANRLLVRPVYIKYCLYSLLKAQSPASPVGLHPPDKVVACWPSRM